MPPEEWNVGPTNHDGMLELKFSILTENLERKLGKNLVIVDVPELGLKEPRIAFFTVTAKRAARQAPIIEPMMVALKSFQLPAEQKEVIAVPERQTIFEVGNAKLSIAPGAVRKDTKVMVKELKEPPSLPPTKPKAPEAIAISKVYDFGPEVLRLTFVGRR